jgi:hypothetical protein
MENKLNFKFGAKGGKAAKKGNNSLKPKANIKKEQKIPETYRQSKLPPKFPTVPLDDGQEYDPTIKRDIYNIFKESTLGRENGNLHNQIKFFILYTQTYLLDAIHDFGVSTSPDFRNTVTETWVKVYKDYIIKVLKSLGITVNKSICEFLKEKYFNSNTLEDQYVTAVFCGNYNNLNSQDTLQQIMKSILQIMKMPVQPIIRFYNSGRALTRVIYYNSIIDKDKVSVEIKNTIIVNDVLPSFSKTNYIQNTINSFTENKEYKIANIIGTPHSYDSANKTDIFNIPNIDLKIETLLPIDEYFTFHDDNYSNQIKIPIIQYFIKKNKDNTELNILNFFGTVYDKEYLEEGTRSRVNQWQPEGQSITANLTTIINIMNKSINNNFKNYSDIQKENFIILHTLFKTIGDKSKRDLLYVVKTTTSQTVSDITNYIFISNDILSAMIGAIEFPGSIITGSSVNDKILGSGVEALAIRSDSILETERQKLPSQAPEGAYSGIARGNEETGETGGEVTSALAQAFGKSKNISLKQINKLIKSIQKL